MNSEELEISLRTEFENYLKNVFADMRQEISQLQTKIEAEIENHKSQLDVVFKDALSRAETGADFDAGFKDSVLEHLRLARDEGARITATAFAAAEEMDRESAVKTAGIKELHAAINDISSKDSQGEILKTLVHHASQFAPRGAFFVVKKEHFVAWRTFDGENGSSEESVQDVFLPVSSDSILSESVRSLSTVESNSETYGDDADVLNKLGFGSPDKTYAIPLVARGRGVAVLYADPGAQGGEVNIEALESMVHVAGLTVEILASARGASPRKKAASEYSAEAESAPVHQTPADAAPAEAPVENSYRESYENESSENGGQDSEAPSAENNVNDSYQSQSYSNEQFQPATESSEETSSGDHAYSVEPEETKQNFAADDYSENYSSENRDTETAAPEYEKNTVQPEESYPTYEDGGWSQPATTETAESAQESYADADQNSHETSSWSEPSEDKTPMISAQDYADHFVKEADSPAPNYSFEPTVQSEPQPSQDFSVSSTGEYNFDKPQSYEPETFSAPPSEIYAPVETKANSFESEPAQQAESFSKPAMPVAAAPAKSRLSERNVDLPIEVNEDERRLHNDARRFARLLVSEIKLYNEQKVKEGRESSDLYERLREAIDRSREMYDKRVQPPVAAKFDYFHYELVNTLAEGDGNKLGAGYPGAVV